VAIFLLLCLPAVALACLGWQRRWVAEDAFIDLRIVRNVLDGHGPVFNQGERVEANTSALWVGLLAAAGAVARPFSVGSLPLEWIAVALGLLCSALGLWAATVAAARFEERPGPVVPVGALVVAAVPAFWDFTTSGLETGLIFAWLGLSALVLARPAHSGGRAEGRGWPAALLIGLGPLVRPDLAVPACAFFLVLILSTARGAPHALALGATAAALPVGYQIFRMGYYGALVPNTAIAKEAAAARWDQGLRYLLDFAGPYWLWLPVAALSCGWLLDLVRLLRARHWGRAVRLALPVVGGGAHALYVVRLGGDFMHARMLLPSLFALLLPAMATAVPRGARPTLPLLTAAVVVPWALVCAVWLRPPYHRVGNGVGPHGIADERWFYVQLSGTPHPVTLADYDRTSWKQTGDALRLWAERERVLLPWPPEAPGVPADEQVRLRPADTVPARVLFSAKSIGLLGYAAGPHVHIVDRLGLADPIAARVRLERHGRPGHEKDLPGEWVVARFAAPDVLPPGLLTPESARRVRDAEAALRCGLLPELLRAVEAPLDGEGFARNVFVAWRLTALRVPADPSAARRALCAPAEEAGGP
jgi:arabinofuranosyltransferase